MTTKKAMNPDELAAMDRAIVAVEDALRDLRKRFGRHLLEDEGKMVGRSIKFFEHVRYRIHGGGGS